MTSRPIFGLARALDRLDEVIGNAYCEMPTTTFVSIISGFATGLFGSLTIAHPCAYGVAVTTGLSLATVVGALVADNASDGPLSNLITAAHRRNDPQTFGL